MVLFTYPAIADPGEIETSDAAILCSDPGNVRDGYLAAWAMRDDLLTSLRCIHALPGLSAVLLNNQDDERTWRVRITLPGGRAVTAFGWPCGFRNRGESGSFSCAQVPGS